MRDEGIDAVRYSIIDALDGLTDFEGFPVSDLNYLQVIRKLRKQLTWRPVSEKPKEGQIVLVAYVVGGFNTVQYIDGYMWGMGEEDGCVGEFNFARGWLPIPPMEEEK